MEMFSWQKTIIFDINKMSEIMNYLLLSSRKAVIAGWLYSFVQSEGQVVLAGIISMMVSYHATQQTTCGMSWF